MPVRPQVADMSQKDLRRRDIESMKNDEHTSGLAAGTLQATLLQGDPSQGEPRDSGANASSSGSWNGATGVGSLGCK